MADTEALHRSASDWYAEHARDLPWRRPPYAGDPYAVLVSEVMLQQTQVERTTPKFLEFMARFPTIQDLASVPVGEVITIWSGMGYNNRAVRLHRLARTVVDEHAGRLPSTVDELIALPGIGSYTAAAVACFAFGASVPVLDTNIYRVLSRVEYGAHAPERSAIEPLALGLVPTDGNELDALTWHQALMDIGAIICTVAMPSCPICPLEPHCKAAPLLRSNRDRKLAEASVPYAPKQSKFAGSTRFYRGRIVDALRDADGAAIAMTTLAQRFTSNAVMDEVQLASIVDSLVKDGLVLREGDSLRLP